MKRALPTWVWPLLALLALLLYNALFTPGFFSLEMREGQLFGSLVDILNRAAPIALISLGMTLVIATGGVDLSVGALVAISGAIAALAVNKGLGLPVAMGYSLGACLVLGLCNGLMVGYLRMQPIVATLVLMVAGRGIAQLLSDGQIVTFTDPSLAFFGGGHLFGLPFSVTLVALGAGIVFLLSRRTAIGMFVEASGDNPVASRYAGIDVRTVHLFVYALTGVCAGLAGLVVAAETKAADANNAGLYFELDAILAVVLGGTALTGGRFNLAGTLVGALLIQALTTTILMKGVAAEWTLVVKALVVLGVCLLQSPDVSARLRAGRIA